MVAELYQSIWRFFALLHGIVIDQMQCQVHGDEFWHVSNPIDQWGGEHCILEQKICNGYCSHLSDVSVLNTSLLVSIRDIELPEAFVQIWWRTGSIGQSWELESLNLPLVVTSPWFRCVTLNYCSSTWNLSPTLHWCQQWSDFNDTKLENILF